MRNKNKNKNMTITANAEYGFAPDWKISIRVADNLYWETYPIWIEYYRGNADRWAYVPVSYNRLNIPNIKSLIGDHVHVTLCAQGEVCTHRVLDLVRDDYRASDDMLAEVIKYIEEIKNDYEEGSPLIKRR